MYVLIAAYPRPISDVQSLQMLFRYLYHMVLYHVIFFWSLPMGYVRTISQSPDHNELVKEFLLSKWLPSMVYAKYEMIYANKLYYVCAYLYKHLFTFVFPRHFCLAGVYHVILRILLVESMMIEAWHSLLQT